ncbi:response regulator [Clostridium algidicarnis]|uniref:response regulator n=1 Tax=Clostridium algidicarnis TaxID=37659 RepID=UPI001C0D61E8|nr:response regulator [Clostridium algidicarnis]MBU3193342.1 response regulator [Clostridium algidicarnis]
MISVVIVEDDLLVADLNKSYVESVEGFYVKKMFNNGQDALIYLIDNKVDLILLDVHMPGLNGIELLEEIRRRDIMSDVILVTSEQETANIDRLLKLGAVDYIVKPFRYSRIKKALKSYELRYKLIHYKLKLRQVDVDKITNNDLVNDTNDFQKGINERTLKRIYEYMKSNSGLVYTNELVAEKTRMSRVTTKKYLDYMVKTGRLVADLEYKSVGRPVTLYKFSSKKI